MNICFVIENLGGGGAERVLVNLVNNMDVTNFNITVVTLFDEGVNASSLKPHVNHINLNKKKFKGMKFVCKFIPKKILYSIFLKKIVEENNIDLVVAYMTGLPTFVSAGASVPKIAWIHGEFFADDKLNLLGLKKIYNKFDEIVGVSKYVCDCAKKNIGFSQNPGLIFNVNDVNKILKLSNEESELSKEKINIITVGCLEKTKGYDRLINVCEKLFDDGFDFNLNILGEGIERTNLENQIKENNLGEKIRLLGYQKNPYSFMKNSDIFVCSSRTEGLSTVVSEAIILGLPVVSTDVSGAKEILGENNEFGIVTDNDEESLFLGMKKMLESDELKAHYRKQAEKRAEFFNTENTVNQAEELFETTVN